LGGGGGVKLKVEKGQFGILVVMKTIVGHKGADLDAIMSIWILKRFKTGWENAELDFVPAGDRLDGEYVEKGGTIEVQENGREVIHVDTGLGKLDHHHTGDMNLCAAKLTYEYVLADETSLLHAHETKKSAVDRMVAFAVDIDHFQEIFYPNSRSDLIDLSIVGIIDGYKMTHEYDDHALCEYIFEALDAILHTLEAKIYAEVEIEEKGKSFDSKFGKALSIETVNDAVMKEGLKMGHDIVVRRDPNHGFIRIKAKPAKRGEETHDIDLTSVYEWLVHEDADATWFLHASKRMLLNGSAKNPNSRPSQKSLEEIVEFLKK